MLAKRDNQQRKVRIPSQQRREACVLEPKCESRVCLTGRELRISEPCFSDSRRKGGSQKVKSPRQPKANLFDPPLTDLRDYLIKRVLIRSFRLVALNGSSWQCSLNAAVAHMQANSRCSDDWPRHPDQPRGVTFTEGKPYLTWSTLKLLQTWQAEVGENNRQSTSTSLTQNQECIGILALGLVQSPLSIIVP